MLFLHIYSNAYIGMCAQKEMSKHVHKYDNIYIVIIYVVCVGHNDANIPLLKRFLKLR